MGAYEGVIQVIPGLPNYTGVTKYEDDILGRGNLVTRFIMGIAV